VTSYPDLVKSSVVVLAVPHQLQGEHFQNYVDDPRYTELLKTLLFGVEFLFEEASGQKPSIAEKLVKAGYAKGHYSAVDRERSKFGISDVTIDPGRSTGWYSCQLQDEHRKREELWLARIQAEKFEKALMICGLSHSLSFTFRLEAAGFDVDVYDYIPFAILGAT
jgi:hypothetical protein